MKKSIRFRKNFNVILADTSVWFHLFYVPVEHVRTSLITLLAHRVFSILKSLPELQKAHIKIVALAIYLHLPIFSFTNTLSHLWQNKKLLWLLFPQQIRPQSTVQLYILQGYSSVRISFNMNNKCQALPILYTMLVLICKFQSLLFYSELNEVCGSYV